MAKQDDKMDILSNTQYQILNEEPTDKNVCKEAIPTPCDYHNDIYIHVKEKGKKWGKNFVAISCYEGKRTHHFCSVVNPHLKNRKERMILSKQGLVNHDYFHEICLSCAEIYSCRLSFGKSVIFVDLIEGIQRNVFRISSLTLSNKK